MANKVTIRNRTAHMKQLQLGGGRSITIPPTAEGMPGLAVTFDSDEEHKRFQAALGGKVVKGWIDRKELEVDSGAAEAEAPAPKQPPSPPPAPPSAEPPPSRHFGRRGDRE